jgi:hypothetical protein
MATHPLFHVDSWTYQDMNQVNDILLHELLSVHIIELI